ncbi:CapA family protein [Mesorhizobium sp. M0894]|uniref:CapA family protein n=1 Tax=unclassified Mesorhizobium TaxID=325217 RepID=UPI0033397F78
MEEREHQDGYRSLQRADFDSVGSTATSVADGFTMVAVGDLIVARALTRLEDPGFSAVVKILNDADVTFGNLETNIFDIRSFEGSPQAQHGGAYHISLPELGADLKKMGFDMLSYANNHTFDWGLEGMRETCRILDENEIIYAGVGENLAQAGAARFFETPRGRTSLLSFASTFLPPSRAGDPAGEAPGRPGVNALRLSRKILLPRVMLESVRRIRDALPGFKFLGGESDEVVLAEVTYKLGAEANYSYVPNERDVADILRNVRRGKQFSDFCLVTNHGHEPGNWSQYPADYERGFAHKVIDAGADAYVVHGPHQLRGIEIYKGRPILYSLGNFMMDDLHTPVGAEMFEARGKDPRIHTDAEVSVQEMAEGYDDDVAFTDPVFYESVIAVSKFEQNQLAELHLVPVELGFSHRFANRGIPRLAAEGQARAILERLQRLSESFGTKIVIKNNIGVIKTGSGLP